MEAQTGYKVTEYPFEYKGEDYVGYVIHRISKNWLGMVKSVRMTHFTSRAELDKFLSDIFILDSNNFLIPLQKNKTA